MTAARRWARWIAAAASVSLLFLVAAILGSWSPDLQRLTTSVRVLSPADYRADLTLAVAPLSQKVFADAAGDRIAPRPSPTPRPSPSASPFPTPSGSATPTPTPTLPLPSPTLPLPTPTLPIPTPTLPIPTPTLPIPPLP
jgi:hypothetical protein